MQEACRITGHELKDLVSGRNKFKNIDFNQDDSEDDYFGTKKYLKKRKGKKWKNKNKGGYERK